AFSSSHTSYGHCVYRHLPPPYFSSVRLSPSSSSLFPYTTLFRSDERRDGTGSCQPGHPLFDATHLFGGGKLHADRNGRQALQFGDRKSTRLNSSHVAISYAVFCLKKKKTTINLPICFSYFSYAIK